MPLRRMGETSKWTFAGTAAVANAGVVVRVFAAHGAAGRISYKCHWGWEYKRLSRDSMRGHMVASVCTRSNHEHNA